MTDRTVIEELLIELDRNRRLLVELVPVPRDEFLREPRHHLYAERCFQLAIQCLVDVCHWIVSRKGWARPEDSREAILVLGRNGVLPPDFADRIAGMAGFRNILVHAYLRINREIVHAYLSRLDDFLEFTRHVESFLDREDDGTRR